MNEKIKKKLKELEQTEKVAEKKYSKFLKDKKRKEKEDSVKKQMELDELERRMEIDNKKITFKKIVIGIVDIFTLSPLTVNFMIRKPKLPILFYIIHFSLFVFFVYDISTGHYKIIDKNLSDKFGYDSFAHVNLMLLYHIICFYLMYKNFFVRFCWFCVAEIWHAVCSNEKYSGKYKNIEAIKDYRNAKLGSMNMENAADLYKKTAWMDGLDRSDGKNTEAAKDYVNAKLGSMSNEKAIKWLKDKE